MKWKARVSNSLYKELNNGIRLESKTLWNTKDCLDARVSTLFDVASNKGGNSYYRTFIKVSKLLFE